MKNKQGTLLLTVILAAPAFAFADNFPGHSKNANDYVSFSEDFTGRQDPRAGTARCNFVSGSPKENGPQLSSIAGASFSGIPKGESVHLVDFSANQGASSDKDEDKGKVKGKPQDGSSNGSGATSSAIVVTEPDSQTLLLFGLAGAGMFFYRRRSLTNAI